MSHWSDQDIMDIIWGIDATDGHPIGAGYPWGWQGSFFCVDCQQRISIVDLDKGGRHPACGELIVTQIDRMLRLGRKIREKRSEAKSRQGGVALVKAKGISTGGKLVLGDVDGSVPQSLTAQFDILKGHEVPCQHPSGFLFMRRVSADGVTVVDLTRCPHCGERRLETETGKVAASCPAGKGWTAC